MADPVANRLLPALAVRLIGAWVLAGALFKLLAGTPADLPAVVQDVPLELGLVYKLVIAIELCIVLGAFFKPKLTWPVTALLLVLFDVILVQQMAAGSSNCGCFGSKITMPPWVMLAIDSALLLLLLASRPWSGLRRAGAPLWLLLALCLPAAAAPWILDREATAPPTPPAPEGDEPADTEAATVPPYVIFELEEWVGESVYDIDLFGWLPEGTVDRSSPDATWIFYRQSCDHCAEHLEELALADDGSTFYVLVQVTDDLDQSQSVHLVPVGDHVVDVRLPEGTDYVLTTPAEMIVAGYEVTTAREIPHDDEH